MGRGVLRNPAGFDRALRAWSQIPLGGSACLVLHLVAYAFLARGLSTSSKRDVAEFTSYQISQGGANVMHLELVVIEPLAQGDGIAINSGVLILESRLDMTKRARKTLNYEKI